MASIGLYDLDLFHNTHKTLPNFELMKVYSYYHKNGDVVNLMKRGENEGRYNKIYYFKENKTKTPKNLNLVGENKERMGYGFYKRITRLNDEIKVCQPIYTPYSPYYDKMKKSFEMFSRSSIVRLEDKDFTGLNEDNHHIFIVDHQPLTQSCSKDFLEAYKLHRLHFYYPPEVSTEEEFHTIETYTELQEEPVVINFIPSNEFIRYYYNDNIRFNWQLWQDFIPEKKLRKFAAAICLFYQTKNYKMKALCHLLKDKDLSLILYWGTSGGQISFADFAGDKKIIIERQDATLRSLLKANPKRKNSQLIDFNSYL